MARTILKLTLFILLSYSTCFVQANSQDVRRSIVKRRKPIPGSPIKLQVIDIERSTRGNGEEDINVDDFVDKTSKRARRAINPDFSPKIRMMHLNDSHNMAYVHWSGDNRETVVVLTRDRNMKANSKSTLWISRDYAQTFQNVTTKLKISNGSIAQISLFHASPVDKMKYIFVDRLHKYIFTSTDDCKTFKKTAVTFTPDDITFHVTDANVILAYDRTSYIKRLYVSQDFGTTWNLKDERVRSYYWGIPPFENTNTLFIERQELSGGRSLVVKTDYFTNKAVSLVRGVNDFEVMDGFMFATKPAGSGKRGLTLMVSCNRSAFHDAQIPTSQPTLDFLVSDVSENQVFLSVSHSVSTTHLYISDSSGLKYSLSLPRVLYFSVKTGSPWLRRYIHQSFVDLHKVDSLRGVYIASQLSQGRVGRRHLASYITFDKGGKWQLLAAPKVDMNNKLLNCSLPNCSLHVSQDFGHYYPYSRYTPMLSSPSAPGIVLAMGTPGKSLKLNADLFMSTNGGLTWEEVLKGSYYYNMGDHGGIIVAVPRGSPTNLFYYSWNEGEHWLSKTFLSSDRIYVYGLLTEPGEKNTKFTIFGSHTQKHEWVVVHIDLQKALGNPCKLSQDYKDWIPSDEYNSTVRCLMGRRSIYRRRIAHAHCFNGYNFDRPITVQNCECTREDFECDVGYKLIQGSSCTWDSSSGLQPTPIPSYCPAGSTYLKSKGYRKVAGDSCNGGKESDYSPSRVACPVSSLPEFILYAQRRYIKRLTIGSNQETTLPLPGLQQTIALDFDYKENCVYWADIQLDTIKRAFLNGSGIIQTLHSSMHQVEGIALDWMGNNLYWVDAGAKKIEVSRKNGQYRKILYAGKVLDKPRALALDPMKGLMYWTDWGTPAKIVKAHMSGNSSYALINSSIHWPNGICIDFLTSRIYWTDAWYDRIETVDFSGQHRMVVTSSGLRHPYSIAIYKQFMYWDDWNTHTIMRALKRGAASRRVVRRSLIGVMDLKVFHKDIQQGNNSCSRQSTCKFLCLASPVTPYYKCACPDNMLTITSSSGIVTCKCQNNTSLDSNGDCTSHIGTCPSGEFTCNNRNCIPNSWRCDHENDCGDNSDEAGCPHGTCSPTDFQCPSGLCIRKSWLCDHDDDCGDMADERNCTFPSCRSDQFTCKNHRCILKRWVCDSDNDCRDGSDEAHCTPAPPTTPHNATCSTGYYACNNGRCIPQSWFCDYDNDCGDNSDEPPNCHRTLTCSSSQFTCTNKRCVSLRWLCDGDNDCGDNSDEIGCKNATTVAPTSYTPSVSCNKKSEFRCRNGNCVARDVCGDGVNDCGDYSDETICKPYTTKPPSHVTTKRPCHYYEFHCTNGFCVNYNKTCDNTNDCGDWSDERQGCTARPPTVKTVSTPSTAVPTCAPPFIKCQGSSTCISPQWVCDSTPDCPLATDEKYCPSNTPSVSTLPPTCSPNEFACDNSRCIPGQLVCNNKKDCKDGTDEQACIGPAVSVWECNKNYQYKGVVVCDNSTTCLSIAKRCDGFVGPCSDRTDELNCDSVPNKKLVSPYISAVNINKTLKLSWVKPAYQPSKGMQSLGFVVSYSPVSLHGLSIPNDERKWTSINIKDNTRTSVSLPHLVICSEYEFTIQAVWARMVGPAAEPIKMESPVVSTGPPGNLTFTRVKEDSIKLSWKSPSIYCRPVSDYKISIDKPGWKEQRFQYTGNVNSAVIEHLNDTSTYTIWVQAYYSDGNLGMQSIPLYVTPKPTVDYRISKKSSKLIWALPVGIVSAILFMGLVVMLAYFIRKSHRLQGSMYALLRRNGHESDGEVTFHADDDDPLIRGFADDVPLVTA